ncbi:hypothetical protein GH714_040043 [Hevea brasiliensis]|uniref:HD domain-containing protein n=1 Tax=Hevea brasiliensis TaxID=3981 RepID=A0A6A6MIM1_HEVBR|nr:hypothetical protein GH714_040043 [Hevea brasiliensis]
MINTFEVPNILDQAISSLRRNHLKVFAQVNASAEASEEIKELWAEYENNASLEANLVKDFDKVVMILQALEYEMGKFSEHGKVLDEFFLSTAGKFQTEIGKSWALRLFQEETLGWPVSYTDLLVRQRFSSFCAVKLLCYLKTFSSA